MPVMPEVDTLTTSLFLASGCQGSDPGRYRLKASQMHRQWIAEAAYYRWLDRGRPMWDALADWLAAEADYRRRADDGGDVFTPAQIRREAVEVAAYCNYVRREPADGDQVADWCAAEGLARAQ